MIIIQSLYIASDFDNYNNNNNYDIVYWFYNASYNNNNILLLYYNCQIILNFNDIIMCMYES